MTTEPRVALRSSRVSSSSPALEAAESPDLAKACLPTLPPLPLPTLAPLLTALALGLPMAEGRRKYWLSSKDARDQLALALKLPLALAFGPPKCAGGMRLAVTGIGGTRPAPVPSPAGTPAPSPPLPSLTGLSRVR